MTEDKPSYKNMPAWKKGEPTVVLKNRNMPPELGEFFPIGEVLKRLTIDQVRALMKKYPGGCQWWPDGDGFYNIERYKDAPRPRLRGKLLQLLERNDFMTIGVIKNQIKVASEPMILAELEELIVEGLVRRADAVHARNGTRIKRYEMVPASDRPRSSGVGRRVSLDSLAGEIMAALEAGEMGAMALKAATGAASVPLSRALSDLVAEDKIESVRDRDGFVVFRKK